MRLNYFFGIMPRAYILLGRRICFGKHKDNY